MVALLVAAGVGGYFLVARDSPTEVATEYLDAFSSQDFDGLRDTVCARYADEYADQWRTRFAELQGSRLTVTLHDTQETIADDETTAKVTGTMRVEEPGKKPVEQPDTTVTLIEENGGWKVCQP